MTALHHGRFKKLDSFASDRQTVRSSPVKPYTCVPATKVTTMGINCLLPFLKDQTKKVHLNKFKGQTAAVDGFCWLHKALTASVSRTGKFDR